MQKKLSQQRSPIILVRLSVSNNQLVWRHFKNNPVNLCKYLGTHFFSQHFCLHNQVIFLYLNKAYKFFVGLQDNEDGVDYDDSENEETEGDTLHHKAHQTLPNK